MKNITLLGGILFALLAFPALSAPVKEVSYKKDAASGRYVARSNPGN